MEGGKGTEYPTNLDFLQYDETKWCNYWLKLQKSGGMSVHFSKCNIRIPSEPTESSLIIMTAVERLPHEAQASLLAS